MPAKLFKLKLLNTGWKSLKTTEIYGHFLRACFFNCGLLLKCFRCFINVFNYAKIFLGLGLCFLYVIEQYLTFEKVKTSHQ